MIQQAIPSTARDEAPPESALATPASRANAVVGASKEQCRFRTPSFDEA